MKVFMRFLIFKYKYFYQKYGLYLKKRNPEMKKNKGTAIRAIYLAN